MEYFRIDRNISIQLYINHLTAAISRVSVLYMEITEKTQIIKTCVVRIQPLFHRKLMRNIQLKKSNHKNPTYVQISSDSKPLKLNDEESCAGDGE